MRARPRPRRDSAHLVTEARRSRSEDIAYRERRYLIMMAFRVVCFAVAVICFAQGAGWLAAIPAVAAIVIPYFAVVFANGGREPTSLRGFRAYEPHLPMPYSPADRDTVSGDVSPPAQADGAGPKTP
jgi:Protein of unknown function (DUF3099)